LTHHLEGPLSHTVLHLNEPVSQSVSQSGSRGPSKWITSSAFVASARRIVNVQRSSSALQIIWWVMTIYNTCRSYDQIGKYRHYCGIIIRYLEAACRTRRWLAKDDVHNTVGIIRHPDACNLQMLCCGLTVQVRSRFRDLVPAKVRQWYLCRQMEVLGKMYRP